MSGGTVAASSADLSEVEAGSRCFQPPPALALSAAALPARREGAAIGEAAGAAAGAAVGNAVEDLCKKKLEDGRIPAAGGSGVRAQSL